MTDEERQLETLREGLGKLPSELPFTEVYPIFVPNSFFANGNWPGPYELLRVPGLGLTWSIFQPDQTMRYVDRGIEQYWNSQGVDWRDEALKNLWRSSEERLWTHEFRSENGRMFALAMMHPDGAGPSRLLLNERLEEEFPEGYFVALPEMSCGFVLSVKVSDRERAQVEDVVRQCYADGTRPLVPGIHKPALLNQMEP